MEGEAEDLDMEVDGVAGQIAFGPAPVGVFDDEAGIGGQDKIARFAFDQFESAFLEERNQRGETGGADWLARPGLCRRPPMLTTGITRGCHSLFSIGVG